MSANGTLEYDVKVSGPLPAAGVTMPNGEPAHWSPLSHTLVYGPTEAALVDPPITVAQTAALGDWIEAKGRRLAYVFITHWHADHWLGTSELAARFPGVTVYASPGTVSRIADATPGGVPGGPWSTLFPGQLPRAPIPLLAQPVPAGGHKDAARDDGPANIDETRRYLDDAARLLSA